MAKAKKKTQKRAEKLPKKVARAQTCKRSSPEELGGGAVLPQAGRPDITRLELSLDHAKLFVASPTLLLWAEDVVERLQGLQKQGLMLGADTSDSVWMLAMACKKARGLA